MSPLSPLNPSSPSGNSSFLFLLKNDPTAGDFEKVINQMVSQNLSRPAPSETAIQYQQRLEEFNRKLAALSSMLEQAQIAMNGSGPSGKNSPGAEQEYFYLKSKLGQVGLPDGTNNLI